MVVSSASGGSRIKIRWSKSGADNGDPGMTGSHLTTCTAISISWLLTNSIHRSSFSQRKSQDSLEELWGSDFALPNRSLTQSHQKHCNSFSTVVVLRGTISLLSITVTPNTTPPQDHQTESRWMPQPLSALPEFSVLPRPSQQLEQSSASPSSTRPSCPPQPALNPPPLPHHPPPSQPFALSFPAAAISSLRLLALQPQILGTWPITVLMAL